MATLADYEAVAPTVTGIGDFTLGQIETKLAAVPEPPPPPEPPTITKARIVEIFNTVFSKTSPELGVASAGGWGSLAAQVGLWPSQVKQIVFEMSAMLDVYRDDQ